MQELSKIRLRDYKLTMCNGVAVVRNVNRITSLLGVRSQLIPTEFHDLLAFPNFTGSYSNEQITWTTDVFKSQPQPLSALRSDEAQRYHDILKDALNAYASAIAGADDQVKKMLYAAITYPSDDSVYCADGRVVLTNWGMTPIGDNKVVGMPWGVDITERKQPITTEQKEEEKPEIKPEINQKPEIEEEPKVKPEPEIRPEEPEIKPQTDTPPTPPTKKTDNESNPIPVKPKRGWLRWLWLLLIPIAIFVAYLLGAFNSCQRETDPMESVLPVTPPFDKSNVRLSNDSLRYIVDNRLILLIDGDRSLEEFIGAFRQKYPNTKKYILSNPDTLFNRITLNLPAEERDDMEERLPEDFLDFGLIVIPESIYRSSYVPNDPALRDSRMKWYFDECSVFDAWDVTMGSEDVLVCVIDDGFDINHPELKGKIVKPFNAINRTNKVTPSDSGHGTHVASTIVGYADNDEGTSGIAPKCKVMPVQVADNDGMWSTSAMLDGMKYALENGANVVNMSGGLHFGDYAQFAPLYMQKNFRDNAFKAEEKMWKAIFERMAKKNMIVCLSGGNENILIGMDPIKRSENTIRVSATTPDKRKADFSNFGDYSTVSAPGVDIFNAIPGGKYTFMDGTSMATPIVAGGCALLLSNNPSLNVHDVIKILRETGTPSPSDVGPIVNFARALKAQPSDADTYCEAINQRYQQLLKEIEQIKREHPECIEIPDTMTLPENPTIDMLDGRWKSTTTLTNEEDESVVLYFTFNGTPKGKLEIVEPDGTIYSAPLNVSIAGKEVRIDQPQKAEAPGISRKYDPYRFKLRPDRNGKAQGQAKNKIDAMNMFDFNLIQI